MSTRHPMVSLTLIMTPQWLRPGTPQLELKKSFGWDATCFQASTTKFSWPRFSPLWITMAWMIENLYSRVCMCVLQQINSIKRMRGNKVILPWHFLPFSDRCNFNTLYLLNVFVLKHKCTLSADNCVWCILLFFALKVYSLRSMSVCLPGELLITCRASEAFFFEAELSNLADSL